MATRSYTIVSHYTPPTSDHNDDAPGSADEGSEGDELEQEKIWQTGPLYKSRSADSDIYVSHRAAHPPRFVPAVLSHEAHETFSLSEQSTTAFQLERSRPLADSEKEGLGSWYKSLRSTTDSKVQEAQSTIGPVVSTEIPASTPPPTHSPRRTVHTKPKPSKKRKTRPHDWFILNALPTSTQTSHPSSTTFSSSSSLADILSRAPPPLPGSNDPKFIPPLRTKLGPGNRGYILLAQQGWKEGEGLGSWRTRPITQSLAAAEDEAQGSDAAVEGGELGLVDAAESTSPMGEDSRETDVPDASVKTPQIIDLTVSDDDSAYESSEDIIPSSLPLPEPSATEIDDVREDLDPSRTVLLAPLKTYLKSDRLGIGARPKPSSSFASLHHSRTQKHTSSTTSNTSSTSVKRKPLTDTAQAMYDARDKERRKREEEHRALMLRLKGGKRGSKGFAAVKREDERRRKDLLAYMNS